VPLSSSSVSHVFFEGGDGGGLCGNRASAGSFCLYLSFDSRADHLMSLCLVDDG
jgi:hypothetical protein